MHIKCLTFVVSFSLWWENEHLEGKDIFSHELITLCSLWNTIMIGPLSISFWFYLLIYCILFSFPLSWATILFYLMCLLLWYTFRSFLKYMFFKYMFLCAFFQCYINCIQFYISFYFLCFLILGITFLKSLSMLLWLHIIHCFSLLLNGPG